MLQNRFKHPKMQWNHRGCVAESERERSQAVCMMIAGCPAYQTCRNLHCVCIFLFTTHSLNLSPSLHHFNLHAPSPSLVSCRTGYGALPSPTQRVPRSCSPQAAPVVTATASCGTQTARPSAGSLCLRT